MSGREKRPLCACITRAAFIRLCFENPITHSQSLIRLLLNKLTGGDGGDDFTIETHSKLTESNLRAAFFVNAGPVYVEVVYTHRRVFSVWVQYRERILIAPSTSDTGDRV
jgi:hypothetical protein